MISEGASFCEGLAMDAGWLEDLERWLEPFLGVFAFSSAQDVSRSTLPV